MRCLKDNPRRRPRLTNAADVYEKACDINLILIANLLDTLHEVYKDTFSRPGMERFLGCFMDNVKWLEADGDSELREYRMRSTLTDIPYISEQLADEILVRLAALAPARTREVLKSPEFRSGLIENTILMMSTLWDDYGFRHKRLGKVISRWLKGEISDAEGWMKSHIDFHNDREADRKDIVDKLLKAKPKAPRISPREQIDARRELEALRAYQDDVRGEN